MIEIPEENKKKISKALLVFIIILSAYFVVMMFSEIKKYSMLGQSTTPNVISFSGHGEVNAIPDIASVYFTINKVAKTVKEAQAGVAEIEKKSLDLLKTKKIADKDIKTTNASFNPKYDYTYTTCPIGVTYNCGYGKQIIIGYEASESIVVKIRNIDDVGDIMQSLGTLGVSDLNGPNFAIDKEDASKAQARKLAIDDAKRKAEALARDLDVTLVKIISFSEEGNYPIMYAESAMMKRGVEVAAPPALIPKGENTISSDVTITYEIR